MIQMFDRYTIKIQGMHAKDLLSENEIEGINLADEMKHSD